MLGFRVSTLFVSIHGGVMNIPALLIGRILLAIPFLVLGAMHFPGAENMAGMVPAWLPDGVL